MIIVLAAGIVLSLAPRYSTLMGIELAVVGLLALPFAWTGADIDPTARDDNKRAERRSALAWAMTLVLACLCELVAFVFGRIAPDRTEDFPSISMVVDPLLHQPWPRAVFIFAWLGLGLLLVRPAARRPIADAAAREPAGGDAHPAQRAG